MKGSTDFTAGGSSLKSQFVMEIGCFVPEVSVIQSQRWIYRSKESDMRFSNGVNG